MIAIVILRGATWSRAGALRARMDVLKIDVPRIGVPKISVRGFCTSGESLILVAPALLLAGPWTTGFLRLLSPAQCSRVHLFAIRLQPTWE